VSICRWRLPGRDGVVGASLPGTRKCSKAEVGEELVSSLWASGGKGRALEESSVTFYGRARAVAEGNKWASPQ